MQQRMARASLLLALFPLPVLAQPASVVSVNPQLAARGTVVTVTLTAPPKDAGTVEVLLDDIAIPVPTVDPDGNYRVLIPDSNDVKSPDFIPLGKHRVSVSVDKRLFTGNESLDVELLTPAPKLTAISPNYLVGGGNESCLTLSGQNFATEIPQDNQILFDEVVQPVTWGKQSQVVDRSTIRLCGLHLPDKVSVEVNVRQGEHDTASGLRLTVSQYGRPAIILFSVLSLLVCLLVILGLALVARKAVIGGTEYGVWSIIFLDSETNTYSLSKLQFFLWTDAAILTYSYLAIGRLFAQRLDLPDVPSSLAGIIAIGAGTAIGSQFVSNVHGPKGAGPMKPGLADLITSGGVAAPDRVQMLLWTLVGVVGFCVATFLSDPWTIKDLPQIGSGLMLLMGISSAGYLGGKLARQPGPVLNSITLSPAGPDKPAASASAAPAADLTQPIAAAVRTIELRGRNLSTDATFEINGADLPFRMLAVIDGKQKPQMVSPEDDAGATNMARGLRLIIDPAALGPSDRKTYDSWFQTAGKDLKVGISNPDGQLAELVVTLPPGTEQAHI